MVDINFDITIIISQLLFTISFLTIIVYSNNNTTLITAKDNITINRQNQFIVHPYDILIHSVSCDVSIAWSVSAHVNVMW